MSHMADLLPTWHSASVTALRKFASIRLLALDVDGTLIDDRGQSAFVTINKLANSTLLRPTYFVVATGRTVRGVSPILRQWPATMNSPAILYNGGVVLTPRDKRVAYIRTIPLQFVKTALQLCRAHRRPMLAYVCRPDRILDRGDLEEVYGWSYDWRPEIEFNGLRVKWQSRWTYGDWAEPTALLVRASEGGDEPLRRQLCSLNGIEVTSSGGPFLEIRSRRSNKATALCFVASQLRLARDAVLAIGDNDNDADMLRWAGVGVAVATASADAAASADYECRHGVARGVVEILRLIRSARRYYREDSETKWTGSVE